MPCRQNHAIIAVGVHSFVFIAEVNLREREPCHCLLMIGHLPLTCTLAQPVCVLFRRRVELVFEKAFLPLLPLIRSGTVRLEVVSHHLALEQLPLPLLCRHALERDFSDELKRQFLLTTLQRAPIRLANSRYRTSLHAH